MELRNATLDDAAEITAIYNHYVANTAISFEEELVSIAAMRQRIADQIDSGLPWLVATVDGAVAGYAYASKWALCRFQWKWTAGTVSGRSQRRR